MSKIHPAWDKKRKRGDRFDGKLIKELDSMHVIMPAIYPNRCDNEAFFRETFDITELRAFVDKKNESGNPVKCTVFQALVACTIKLLYLRPKMNRFIANRLMYQRNEVTAAFTVKKAFHDDGAEALAIVNATPNDTFDTIHRQVADRITSSRSDTLDKSSEAMDVVSRMPRRLTRSFVRFIGFLDRVGHCPKGFVDTDPYYASVVLSNLGSLGLDAAYHHLTNWGTTSVFVAVGIMRKEEVEKDDGTREMREFVDLGLTIDERLADGYYYSKTIKCLKQIIEQPELLDRPMCEGIE